MVLLSTFSSSSSGWFSSVCWRRPTALVSCLQRRALGTSLCLLSSLPCDIPRFQVQFGTPSCHSPFCTACSHSSADWQKSSSHQLPKHLFRRSQMMAAIYITVPYFSLAGSWDLISPIWFFLNFSGGCNACLVYSTDGPVVDCGATFLKPCRCCC